VRLLPGGGYAHFAAFLAAYLLINTPAASLTAGAALRPDLAARFAPLMLRLGLGAGVLLAAASVWIADETNLPGSLVLLLAADAPAAGILAIRRGQLFGQQRLVAASSAVVAEPLARCAVGFALIPAVGPLGAAIGVVAGGYLALAVCLALTRRGAASAVAR